MRRLTPVILAFAVVVSGCKVKELADKANIAKDLEFNTQEYLWVKGQILAASAAAFTEGLTNAMANEQNKAYQQMKKSYDEAKDDQSKQMYKQMLDSYEKTMKEGQQITAQAPPEVQYNRQLLKKYDSELAAFTNELGKYENK